MGIWAVQDAKARFSEMLERCVDEGAQIVTKRGEQTVVLVPIEEWRRLTVAARPTLKDILLSDAGRGDLPIVERGTFGHRKVLDL